ncbi:MAG: dual specificity protein phosphatase family protein [Gemmataceae bacterium]
MARNRFPALFGVALVLVALTAPITVALRQQRETRNLSVVTPGVLFRSAQLPPTGLRRLQHDLGIKAIVCIRDESPATEAERRWCEANEVLFVRIDGRNWTGKPGCSPVDGCLRQFLEVVEDPKNHPVLIHCFAGIHRTGGYVAVYRMEVEGWTAEEALQEMRSRGYDRIDTEEDIRGYLQSYRPGLLRTPQAKSSISQR